MDMILSQSQKLNITPKMIQSMEVLQKNALELNEYLHEQSLDNPLFEIEETDMQNGDLKEIDRQRKLEWLSVTDRQNRVYYKDDIKGDYETLFDSETSVESLQDFLKSQLILNKYNESQWRTISYILECVDENGYLKESVEELSEQTNVSPDIVETLIKDIKSLDPVGVGAKDLRECLLLQLDRMEESQLSREIADKYLSEVGKQHFMQIAKKLNVDIKEVKRACEIIQKLDPKPGSAFSSREKLKYVVPDAVVIKESEGLTILINEYSYPAIKVNSYYEELYKTTDDAETKAYIKKNLEKIKQLKETLDNRVSTLSRVMHTIVDRQIKFFKDGPGNKVPMTLYDIAYDLSLHESTVSRAMSGKYLQCTYGLYPLNYFLTPVAAKNVVSGDLITKESIVQKIKEIIASENKSKPLSDDAISKALEDYNIKISRRTVNKYRTELNIPDKSGRKTFN